MAVRMFSVAVTFRRRNFIIGFMLLSMAFAAHWGKNKMSLIDERKAKNGATVKLIDSALTDGSLVYTVKVSGGYIVHCDTQGSFINLHCTTEEAANDLFQRLL